MRVRVLKEFRDKDDFSRVYKEGSIASFDEDRVKYLVSLGLVESTKESETIRPTRSNTKGENNL